MKILPILTERMRKGLINRKPDESVYFFTFHKCASTLFSSYVLKNIRHLEHVDYANLIYNGKISFDQPLQFNQNGAVYGPIRILKGSKRAVARLLVEPTLQPEFIRDKIALFLIRDPRDILVSSYYSFGFSHGYSPVKEIYDSQRKVREEIQKQTLDEYVISQADKQKEKFELLHEVSQVCERGTVLRYEDMINNFDSFFEQFCQHVQLAPKVVEEVYRRSRPKVTEDTSSHQRSGHTRGYLNKLKPDTIEVLNGKFAGILDVFGYEI